MSLPVTVCAWHRIEFLVTIVGCGVRTGEYIWLRKDGISGGTLVRGAGRLTETLSCSIGTSSSSPSFGSEFGEIEHVLACCLALVFDANVFEQPSSVACGYGSLLPPSVGVTMGLCF
jgi:hypothetical protein